jgi:hypothetical protein
LTPPEFGVRYFGLWTSRWGGSSSTEVADGDRCGETALGLRLPGNALARCLAQYDPVFMIDLLAPSPPPLSSRAGATLPICRNLQHASGESGWKVPNGPRPGVVIVAAERERRRAREAEAAAVRLKAAVPQCREAAGESVCPSGVSEWTPSCQRWEGEGGRMRGEVGICLEEVVHRDDDRWESQ